MLNMIKNMITEQVEAEENKLLIVEEANQLNKLEDMIVLGEETDANQTKSDDKESDKEKSTDKNGEKDTDKKKDKEDPHQESFNLTNEEIDLDSVMKEFTEAAENLEEDSTLGVEDNVDLLEKEDPDETSPDEETPEEKEEPDDLGNADVGEDNSEPPTPEEEPEEDDLMNQEVNNEPSNAAPDNSDTYDLGNDVVDDGISTSQADDIPDEEVNLASMEIDLRSNTMDDILPMPPKNARDAIADNEDMLTQRVDSGFGNDFGGGNEPADHDIMNDQIEEPKEDDYSLESFDDMTFDLGDSFNEGISFGEDASGGDDLGTASLPSDGPGDTASGSTGDVGSSDSSSSDSSSSDTPNEVTAAVKDAVNDASSSDDLGDTSIDSVASGDGQSVDGDLKEVFAKLGNMSKTMEDIKQKLGVSMAKAAKAGK